MSMEDEIRDCGSHNVSVKLGRVLSNIVQRGPSRASTQTSPFLLVIPGLRIELLHTRYPLTSIERKVDRFDRGISGWLVSVYRGGTGRRGIWRSTTCLAKNL